MLFIHIKDLHAHPSEHTQNTLGITDSDAI